MESYIWSIREREANEIMIWYMIEAHHKTNMMPRNYVMMPLDMM